LVRTLPRHSLKSHTVTAIADNSRRSLISSTCRNRTAYCGPTSPPSPDLRRSFIYVRLDMSAAVTADPRLRASCSQEPMVDPTCPADSYLIQKTSRIGLRDKAEGNA